MKLKTRGTNRLKRLTWAALAAMLACGGGEPTRACSTVAEQETNVGNTVTVRPYFEDPEGGALTLAAQSSAESVAMVV